MNKSKIIILPIVLAMVLLTSFNTAIASRRQSSRSEVQKFVTRMAKKYHYTPRYINWVLNKGRYSPAVIRHMEKPYEALPWSHYKERFVTQKRIDAGVRYWNRSNKLLAWELREYAIPAPLIVAIIGIESKYGKAMGHFKVIDALTTLAFHYPSRAKFFQKELGSFILMTKVYKARPDSFYGSYAGAMGQCQFMPSSYLFYAVDFHGRGRPNLYSDKADVIFSIGNYLRQNGWEPDQPVATRAQIIGSRYTEVLKRNSRRTKAPTLTLKQLAQYGVHPVGHYNPNLTANLIELQGKNGPEYWLTFHNFFVITRYNTSDLYAMAAFQLGLKIEQAYKKPRKQL